jgi:hypothetical protein
VKSGESKFVVERRGIARVLSEAPAQAATQ